MILAGCSGHQHSYYIPIEYRNEISIARGGDSQTVALLMHPSAATHPGANTTPPVVALWH